MFLMKRIDSHIFVAVVLEIFLWGGGITGSIQNLERKNFYLIIGLIDLEPWIAKWE